MSKKIKELFHYCVSRSLAFRSKIQFKECLWPYVVLLWKKRPPLKVIWSFIQKWVNWKTWRNLYLAIREKTRGKSARELFIAFATSKNGEWFLEKTKYLLEQLFNPQKRPLIHQVFVWCFVISASYTTGKVLSFLLRPVDETSVVSPLSFQSNPSLTPEQIPQLVQNNFFHSKSGMEKQEEKKITIDENIPCLEANSMTSLPLKLTHAIALQSSEKSLVMIRYGGETESKVYREGDKIVNVAKIGRIESPDVKVIFKNLKTGDCEYIALESERTSLPFQVLSAKEGQKMMNASKPKGIESDGNRFLISRSLLNEKVANLENVLTEARAVPITNPDGTLSFRVTEIEPGSIFSYLGIENEDKITHINGKPIEGFNQIMDLFSNLRSIDDLQLSVVKENGTEATLNYSLSQ